MDISKLSRHTHLAKQAIAQALGLGEGGLKNFKPPKKIPDFSANDPLTFITAILKNTTTKNPNITQANVTQHLCGPKGAAALLAKSLLTTKKSPDSFNSLVANQAKAIKDASQLHTINDKHLQSYITNKKQRRETNARGIDWLKLLCAAILLIATHNATEETYDLQDLPEVSQSSDPPMPKLAKDATEDQQETIRTIATDLGQQIEITNSTTNQQTQTSTKQTNSKDNTSNNLLANYHGEPIKISRSTGWGKTEDVEINLISYITPTDYEQIKQIASDLQKLNDTCKTHLDLETLLVDKFPKIPKSNNKYILSPDTTVNSENRDENWPLNLDYKSLIWRSSTITFYFKSTRNQLKNAMTSQDITENIISLVTEHKYGFIRLKGDSKDSPIYKKQTALIETIKKILFPPGHVIPKISTNPNSDNDTSPWEKTLEDLVDSVTKLPTDLPFNIPSNYETPLNAIESQTNGVHCNLLAAIKKDILDVGRYMLENSSAKNTSWRTSEDRAYANEKYAAQLDKVIRHIKKIEETSANSINDWLKNYLHIPENLQYLSSNPLTDNVLSAIKQQVDFLHQKLLHHSLWQMYDNIQHINKNPRKTIAFKAPTENLTGFFQTLEQFWTAIVESANKPRHSPQQPPPEQTIFNNWQNIVNLCTHLNTTYKTISTKSELNAYTFAYKLGEWFTKNLARTYTYFLNDNQYPISLGQILQNFIVLKKCPFPYEQYKLLFSLISTYAPGTKFILNYDGKNVETYPIKSEDLNTLFAALFN